MMDLTEFHVRIEFISSDGVLEDAFQWTRKWQTIGEI